MSAYPPGVTGMEPEIAGYPEGTMNVECSSTGATLMAYEVHAAVNDLSFRLEVAAKNAAAMQKPLPDVVLQIAQQLRDDLGGLEEAEESQDCDFEGEVDVVFTSRTTYEWECPRCGNEQEGELE